MVCSTIGTLEKYQFSFNFNFLSNLKVFNPSGAKGFGTHIGYQGGGGRSGQPPQVSHDFLDVEHEILRGTGSSMNVS